MSSPSLWMTNHPLNWRGQGYVGKSWHLCGRQLEERTSSEQISDCRSPGGALVVGRHQ